MTGFRLLTGGARNGGAPPTNASRLVDWSHALLHRIRTGPVPPTWRLSGGFDLDAAQAVDTVAPDLGASKCSISSALLVDKSLVVAEDSGPAMRYRMLETVRQYALEMLGESGEADAVRHPSPRLLHSISTLLRDASGAAESAGRKIDRAVRRNRQSACGVRWSREGDDIELAVESWHPRCSHSGWRGARRGKAWRGSTPFTSMRRRSI